MSYEHPQMSEELYKHNEKLHSSDDGHLKQKITTENMHPVMRAMMAQKFDMGIKKKE